QTPSHGDGWGGGVSLSPFLPFQAPADAGRLLYLVQRLFPFRGLGGDRRIEYPGEPQGLLVGKILFTLLFHNSPPICRPGQGLSFWARPGPGVPEPPFGPLSVAPQSGAGVWPPYEPAPPPGVPRHGQSWPVAPG